MEKNMLRCCYQSTSIFCSLLCQRCRRYLWILGSCCPLSLRREKGPCGPGRNLQIVRTEIKPCRAQSILVALFPGEPSCSSVGQFRTPLPYCKYHLFCIFCFVWSKAENTNAMETLSHQWLIANFCCAWPSFGFCDLPSWIFHPVFFLTRT